MKFYAPAMERIYNLRHKINFLNIINVTIKLLQYRKVYILIFFKN